MDEKLLFINKEEWGEGEWQNEPDEEKFEYKGYTCRMRRHHVLGVWLGYVLIPTESKSEWLEGPDNYSLLDVHGGITYARYEGDFFCIGFDCGHSCDIPPGIESELNIRNWAEDEIVKRKLGKYKNVKPSSKKRTYKNIEFVRNELKELIDQIEEGND